jgi:hypothetical protein
LSIEDLPDRHATDLQNTPELSTHRGHPLPLREALDGPLFEVS